MWEVRDAIIAQQRENVARWTPLDPNVTRRRYEAGTKNSVGEYPGRVAVDTPLAVYLYAVKADRREMRTGITAQAGFVAATLERVLEVGDVILRAGQAELEVKGVEAAELDGVLIHWRATCEARR